MTKTTHHLLAQEVLVIAPCHQILDLVHSHENLISSDADLLSQQRLDLWVDLSNEKKYQIEFSSILKELFQTMTYHPLADACCASFLCSDLVLTS